MFFVLKVSPTLVLVTLIKFMNVLMAQFVLNTLTAYFFEYSSWINLDWRMVATEGDGIEGNDGNM